jgi:hypothetical protein
MIEKIKREIEGYLAQKVETSAQQTPIKMTAD